MRKTYFIIMSCIICMLSFNAQAQVSDAFEADYTYNYYPNATIIGAQFTEYSGLYFTVEAFEDGGDYYICLRNVDNALNPNPQIEKNYLIDDPLLDKILELTEFYYNKSNGEKYLVASGLMKTTSGHRAFWAYFDINNNYELYEIKVLDNNSNYDPIEYAKGETSNVFKNDGYFALTGATGNNNAYILNLLNAPDASGIQLIHDSLVNDCAIYDIAKHPDEDLQQYVFVGEYKNSSTAVTEIIVGRFKFDGTNFSAVSYGGIEFNRAGGYQLGYVRARNICFGDNNKVYVAGDFTHGDFSILNQSLYCDEIFYLDFGVFDQSLFTGIDFIYNSAERIKPSNLMVRIYRTTKDLISRGDSKVPLIIGTSVQSLNSYNDKFIYEIGDTYVNFDEGGVLGTWYSDYDQLLTICNMTDKPEFYGFTGYFYDNSCESGFGRIPNTIHLNQILWTSKEYEDYTQDYSTILFTNKSANATLDPLCGNPIIIGATYRKITIPNPNNNIDEVAINMYPNPTTENFSIVVSEQTYDVKLYTNNGILVAEYNDCIGETVIDVSNLPSAIYIAKIITSTEVFDKKIMIE